MCVNPRISFKKKGQAIAHMLNQGRHELNEQANCVMNLEVFMEGDAVSLNEIRNFKAGLWKELIEIKKRKIKLEVVRKNT